MENNAQRLTPNSIPESYFRIPVRALQHSTRHLMSLHMNIIHEAFGNDWRLVAEKIGCSTIEIMNMKMKENPMQAVLTHSMRNNLTIGELMTIMVEIDRLDIFQECGPMIEDNVKKYKPIQDPKVSSHTIPLTIGELDTGIKEFFDAFVSCHPQDFNFLQELIDQLEVERGFKLCIIDRDLLIGVGESIATVELIQKRCKRVIIVLSNSYGGSEEERAILKYQMQFAQALAPVADRHLHKLVPMKIDPDIQIPPILLPYNACDYTRSATKEWFWRRVEASLAAPISKGGGYEGPAKRLGITQDRPRAPSESSAGAVNRGSIQHPRTSSEGDLQTYRSRGNSQFYVDLPADSNSVFWRN